jgi:hypothetical protein
MKPDQQSNYWQHDPDEQEPADAPQEPEMYEPEPFEPTPPVSGAPEAASGVAPIAASLPGTEPVHWSAREYIHHERNGLWFVIFGLIVVALIALDLFIFKSYTFTALVIVMAIAVIVYIRRPPRDIDYTLSDQGLYVSDKLYHFSDFKSFGVIQDGDHHSVMLIPTKRFSPGVSVYFPEEAGEKIVDVLGTRLPMESLRLDIIDIITRKLRL